MAFDFKGKRVIVTGASRGIGRSIALGFAEAGAAVSICARGAEGVDAACAEIAQFGGTVHGAAADISDSAAIVDYINEAEAALGGIDILVNNASGMGMTDDEAGWAASLSVDLMASVRASQAAEPFIVKNGGGSIIHISSISGLRPSGRSVPYGAVKAALFQYTMSQAQLLAPKGVRVNCVAPGSVEFAGGTWEKRRLAQDPLYQKTLARIPFGRMGHPQEIANVVLFLASPLASWMTGQTLTVDGGQLLG
jgi:3-oxoacyl-[acyl-carrier protein] reductase